MRRPSSPRHVLSRVPPKMAALLVAAGLALAMVPAVPAWAASNEAHLDRQVLKAMQAGQSLPGLGGGPGGLKGPPADLRGNRLENTPRGPLSPRNAPAPTPPPIRPLPRGPDGALLIY